MEAVHKAQGVGLVMKFTLTFYFEQNCSLENIFTSPLSVFQGISPCYEIVEQNTESKTFHTGLLQY